MAASLSGIVIARRRMLRLQLVIHRVRFSILIPLPESEPTSSTARSVSVCRRGTEMFLVPVVTVQADVNEDGNGE